MSLIDLSVLPSLIILGIACLKTITTDQKRLFHSTALSLGITILLYSHSIPSLAAIEPTTSGAIDNFVTEEQQQLDEDFNLTPDGGHYSGVEHIDRYTDEKTVSDESIEQSIEPYIGDNVIVSVANGSVRFSGRVQNKDVARHIIEQTKALPGVHEITFNLGLEDKAS